MECNDLNCSFDGRRITRKYERNKAVRKSFSVTRQDAHIRYRPYVVRHPLEESPMQAKRDSAMMMVPKIGLLSLVWDDGLTRRFVLDRSDPKLQRFLGVPAKSVVFYYKFLSQQFFLSGSLFIISVGLIQHPVVFHDE